MAEFFLRLLLLVRFLFFVALVYIALHLLFIRLISKTDSKVLWFFSIVTGPLTRPIGIWLRADAPASRVLAVSFAFYAILWLLSRIIVEIAARMLA